MARNISQLILFLLLGLYSFPQEISNISFNHENEKIIIFYDLASGFEEKYDISIYYNSPDQNILLKPIFSVQGDVGKNIEAGQDKKIYWDVLSELDELVGEIYFTIKVKNTINNGTFTDNRDSKTYKWVRIGDQIWMAENLNYKTMESSCLDGDKFNCLKFGRLYRWSKARIACPQGWHLPSDEEFEKLVQYLENQPVKDDRASERNFSNSNARNRENPLEDKNGFNLLYGSGYKVAIGVCKDGLPHFWTSTRKSKEDPIGFCYLSFLRKPTSNYKVNNLSNYQPHYRLSVRCIKD